MIPAHDKTLMEGNYIFLHSQFRHGVVVSGQLHARDTLLQGKQPRSPFNRKSGVNRGGSEWCEEKTIFSRLPGIEQRFLGSPVRTAVTIPSELSQFGR